MCMMICEHLFHNKYLIDYILCNHCVSTVSRKQMTSERLKN